MSKLAFLGKTAVLRPVMPAGRLSRSEVNTSGAALGSDHAFTMEVNETTGFLSLGIIRMWKVLAAAPWVAEVSSATVYPHGNDALGTDGTIAFKHAIAVDDSRAVVLWQHGNTANPETVNWRYYAAVVSRVGDTVSVGAPVDVLTPLTNTTLGGTFDRWDGTAGEGADNWRSTQGGVLELTTDGVVVFVPLKHTSPTSFTVLRSVIVARRLTLSGTTLSPVSLDAGKWINVFDTAGVYAGFTDVANLYTQDIARSTSGQYVIAATNNHVNDVQIVVVAADLPASTASSVLLTRGGSVDGLEVTRVARAPNGTISVVVGRRDVVPKRLEHHSFTVAADGTSIRESAAHDTDRYFGGSGWFRDAANDTISTGQLMVWGLGVVNSKRVLQVAAVGLAAQGGLLTADDVPDDMVTIIENFNSHIIVMPDRQRMVMRLSDRRGENYQHFLYAVVFGSVAPRGARLFFDRM